MKSSNEIMYEISILEGKLRNLNSRTVAENPYEKNGDIYYDHKKVRVGSNAEIASVENQINKLKEEYRYALEYEKNAPKRKEQLEEQIKLKSKRENEDINKYGKMAANSEERMNLQQNIREQEKKEEAIKNIKRRFKKGSAWQKFVATISGRRPNPKKLAELSSKQLEMIYNISIGEANDIKESIEFINNQEDISYNKKKKEIDNAKWDSFLWAMGNESYVDNEIESRRR